MTDSNPPPPQPEPIIPTVDFWSRRANAPTASLSLEPFGHPVEITANRLDVLAAARLSAGRFSRAEQPASPSFQIRLVVHQDEAEEQPPLPPDWPERLTYAGVGDWITVSAGAWGHAFANLQTGQAGLFLSPALAAETRLLSRYFIDHYLLNFLLTRWAMLHASSVFDPTRRRLLVLVAPHNTGKSTTALHLVRAGYHFLADGMLLLQPQEDSWRVGGYPIGEIKLRDDMLAALADYSGQAVQVREQRKTVVDLRTVHPDRLCERLLRPQTIHLCFLEQGAEATTRAAPLSIAQARALLPPNTVFWDEPARLRHNSAALQRLLQTASLHRIKIGPNLADLVSAFEGL